jgi:hypothetical protein
MSRMYPTEEELATTEVSQDIVEKLKQQCIDVTLHYEYEPTEYGMNAVLSQWKESKRKLHYWLSQLPNWNEEKQMAVFDMEQERKYDLEAVRYFVGWLKDVNIQTYGIDFPENVCLTKVIWARTPNLCVYNDAVLEKIFKWLCFNEEKLINEEAVKIFNDWDEPRIHAHVNMKVTKVVGRMLRAMGFDKVDGFNTEFTKFCDAVNPLKITQKAVISINPVDYLRMSMGNSWKSCHTIDKKGIDRRSGSDYSGCYSGGTLSYMLDQPSLIFYTVDPDYKGNDYEMQDKWTRCMFHVGEGKIIQGRMYPQDNDGCNSASDEPRHIVQQAIADAWGINNYWNNKKGTEAASQYIDSDGVNYHDYQYYTTCNLSYPKDYELNTKEITVGAHPICIHCGEEYFWSEAIECEDCYRHINSYECASCGCEIDEDDAIEYEGQYYCTDCVSRCIDTEEFIPNDVLENGEYVYMEGDYDHDTGWYSDDYISEYTTICDICGERHWDSDMYYIDETDVCESCAEDKTGICAECGEIHFYDNLHFDKETGEYYCDDCYNDLLEKRQKEKEKKLEVIAIGKALRQAINLSQAA